MAKILFTSYYKDKSEVRQKELELCVKMNIKNPLIDRIVILLEGNISEFPILLDEKITIIASERPTYQNFFDAANSIVTDEDISIISNTDIFFDDTLALLDKHNLNNTCFALSRYHYQKDQTIKLHHEKYSQDTWIFKGKIKQMKFAGFNLGTRGCLSGETIINYNRGKRDSCRPIKLRDLFKKFNGISKDWDLKLETFSNSINLDGKVLRNKILNVIESGIKKTLKITFEDNTNLIVTPDHRISIDYENFIEAEKLNVGDFVVCKGTMKIKKTGLKRTYKKRVWVYVKHHPFGHRMKLKGFEYIRKTKHRLVVEASINGMDYDTFVSHLNSKSELCNTFKFLEENLEVHHKDEDTLNDDLDNLEILTSSEHAKLHGKERGFDFDYLSKKKIISIEPFEEIMTYDIQMESPMNNFFANDIVVHNCDNRIAFEIKQAGYRLMNPALSIRSIHYHLSDLHNYGNYFVPKPYLPIELCRL